MFPAQIANISWEKIVGQKNRRPNSTSLQCLENYFNVNNDILDGCEERCPRVPKGFCEACNDHLTCDVAACVPHHFDVNGNATDGCETGCPVVAAGLCTKCTNDTTAVRTMQTDCREVVCDLNFFNSDNSARNGCEETCPEVPNGQCRECETPTTCNRLTCNENWFDVDLTTIPNGCEKTCDVVLRSTGCGSCVGRPDLCRQISVTTEGKGGELLVRGGCEDGYLDADGNPLNGCEATENQCVLLPMVLPGEAHEVDHIEGHIDRRRKLQQKSQKAPADEAKRKLNEELDVNPEGDEEVGAPPSIDPENYPGYHHSISLLRRTLAERPGNSHYSPACWNIPQPTLYLQEREAVPAMGDVPAQEEVTTAMVRGSLAAALELHEGCGTISCFCAEAMMCAFAIDQASAYEGEEYEDVTKWLTLGFPLGAQLHGELTPIASDPAAHNVDLILSHSLNRTMFETHNCMANSALSFFLSWYDHIRSLEDVAGKSEIESLSKRWHVYQSTERCSGYTFATTTTTTTTRAVFKLTVLNMDIGFQMQAPYYEVSPDVAAILASSGKGQPVCSQPFRQALLEEIREGTCAPCTPEEIAQETCTSMSVHFDGDSDICAAAVRVDLELSFPSLDTDPCAQHTAETQIRGGKRGLARWPKKNAKKNIDRLMRALTGIRKKRINNIQETVARKPKGGSGTITKNQVEETRQNSARTAKKTKVFRRLQEPPVPGAEAPTIPDGATLSASPSDGDAGATVPGPQAGAETVQDGESVTMTDQAAAGVEAPTLSQEDWEALSEVPIPQEVADLMAGSGLPMDGVTVFGDVPLSVESINDLAAANPALGVTIMSLLGVGTGGTGSQSDGQSGPQAEAGNAQAGGPDQAAAAAAGGDTPTLSAEQIEALSDVPVPQEFATTVAEEFGFTITNYDQGVTLFGDLDIPSDTLNSLLADPTIAAMLLQLLGGTGGQSGPQAETENAQAGGPDQAAASGDTPTLSAEQIEALSDVLVPQEFATVAENFGFTIPNYDPGETVFGDLDIPSDTLPLLLADPTVAAMLSQLLGPVETVVPGAGGADGDNEDPAGALSPEDIAALSGVPIPQEFADAMEGLNSAIPDYQQGVTRFEDLDVSPEIIPDYHETSGGSR